MGFMSRREADLVEKLEGYATEARARGRADWNAAQEAEARGDWRRAEALRGSAREARDTYDHWKDHAADRRANPGKYSS